MEEEMYTNFKEPKLACLFLKKGKTAKYLLIWLIFFRSSDKNSQTKVFYE